MNVPFGITIRTAHASQLFRSSGSLVRVPVIVVLLSLVPSELVQAGVHASPFYEFQVVARRGDLANSTAGALPMTNIWHFVSINDLGRVAFSARLRSPTNEEAVIVAESPTPGLLHWLSDAFCSTVPMDSPGDYLYVQINNDHRVVSHFSWGTFLCDADRTGTGDCTPNQCDFYYPVHWVDKYPFTASRSEDGYVAYNIKATDSSGFYYTNYLVLHVPGNRDDPLIMAELKKQPAFGNPPMVANGGALVFTEGLESDGSVIRIDPGVSYDVLAAKSNGWTRVPWAPAISPDGKAVAFVGEDPSPSQGIYVRLFDEAASALATTRIIDTNTTIAFDDLGNRIRFSSFEDHFFIDGRSQPPARVSVIRYDAGADEDIIGDSLVIAFIATPSSASRTNPAARPKPLLFSDQKGIWTMRIDIQRELSGGNNVVLNRHGALPVVQVGDRIGGATITDLYLWDSLAEARTELDRSPRRTLDGRPTPGEHYLAFWANTTQGPMVIKALKIDTDEDGLLDHWERSGGGIDMDRDGIVDLDLSVWNASVLRKDLFVEIDWVRDRISGYVSSWKNTPAPEAVTPLANMFALAPVLNPDGSMGIDLHVDAGPGIYPVIPFPYSHNTGTGNLEGGDRIGEEGSGRHLDLVYFGLPGSFSIPGVVSRSFYDIKETFFGTTDKRARELAFRYCVFADFYDALRNTAGNPISGNVQAATLRTLTPMAPLPIFDEGAVLVTGGRGAGQVRVIDRRTSTAALLQLSEPWSVIPDSSSTFVLLTSSSGFAEVFFHPAENNHSLSGNDLLVTLGAWGVDQDGYLGIPDDHWRTLAHELGHTMGLRHGGTNHCEYSGHHYASLMNYAHQLRWADTLDLSNRCIVPFYNWVSAGGVPIFPVIYSYAGGIDPTFNDWAYIQLASYNHLPHVGNTFELDSGVKVPETFSVQDFRALFGAADRRPPVVTVIAPPPRATLPFGEALQVRLDVQDESPLGQVRVWFDVNGDGAITDVGEAAIAANVGGSEFTAAFPPASGSPGVRSVYVAASDAAGNTARSAFNVWIGPGGPTDENPPLIIINSPTLAARVSTEAWLVVQITALDNSDINAVFVQFDSNGDGTNEIVTAGETDSTQYQAIFRSISGPAGARWLEVRATDRWLNLATNRIQLNVQPAEANAPVLEIHDPGEGQTIGLTTFLTISGRATDDVTLTNLTVSFDVDGNGTLEMSLVVPFTDGTYRTTFSGSGFPPSGVTGPEGPRTLTVEALDWTGNRAVSTRTVNVRDLLPPSVLFSSPAAEAAVRLGAAFTVDLKVRDDQRVDEVIVSFDLDGDGTAGGTEEVVTAAALGGDNFRASFGNLRGTDGPRVVIVTARDPTMKTTTVRQTVNVAAAAVVQRPFANEIVKQASTFHVQLEVVPGLSVGNVNVSFDIDGNGSLDGPGERVQAIPGDAARQYLASFSNIGGAPGPRSIFIDVMDPAGTTTNSRVRTAEVGSFGGFASPVSRKFGAVPSLPEIGGAGPEDFIAAGPYLFFTANDQLVGRELWRTDGTAEGTLLLRDINPDNPLGSAIAYLTPFNEQVFFAAQDWHGSSFGFQAPHFGAELWRSDGTPAGTVMLKDINPGPDDSSPKFLTVFKAELFFAASDGLNGSELWKSDGTSDGTVLLKDLNPGRLGSGPENLTVVGETLLFAANLSQLWRSDGTSEGTTMVKDIYPGGGASGTPQQLVAVNGKLFFTANDGANGWELWTCDGTESGTVMVKDIYPGLLNGSYPESLTAWNGEVYFTAANSEFGRELWKSDGTEAGTVLLADIWVGTNSSLPSYLVEFDSQLFFSANDGQNGRELWKTDGTTNGTGIAVNLAPYSGPPPTDPRMIYPMRSSSPAFLNVYNGALYFRADDGAGTHGPELWRSDGTPEGTVLVRDIAPGITPRPLPTQPSYVEPKGSFPQLFYAFNGQLYFTATDGQYGSELWKTDGTAVGTRRVRNIAHAPPLSIVAGGPLLYHQGSDGIRGIELWQTTSNGTAMLKDLYPGASNSFPSGFRLFQDQLIFATSNSLWKTDGTAAGTARLQAFNDLPAALFGFVELNDTLLFSGASSSGHELWRTDGTAPGTMLVKDIRTGFQGSLPAHPEILGGQILFQAADGVTGKELWRSDGTPEGTLMLSNINAGAADSNPGKLTAYGGAIIFVASGNSRGYELWRSDGTGPGTMLVKDIRPGSSSSFDSSVLNLRRKFTSFNNALFFSANDGANGYEPWKTDGTMTGTLLVKDIDTDPFVGSLPDNWTVVGNTLFFSANSPYGIELWKTDGTSSGTLLVKNIRGRHPAQGYEQSSEPQNLVAVNGALFFTVTDVDREDGVPARGTGRELWRSDGTDFGTVRLRDIFTGPRSSFIQWATAVNDRLYFVADDGEHGRELWTSDGTFEGTTMVEDLLPGPASSNPTFLTNINGVLYYFADDGADDLSLRQLRPPASTPFRDWLDSVATLSGGDAQLGADPDGDGLSNVVEHDLGSDPDDPLSHGPAIRGVSMFVQDFWTYLDLTYVRRKNALASGLRFWAEHSRDLTGWLLMQTVSETVTPIDGSFDSVTVRVRTPAERSGFARLAVGTSP